MNTVRVDDALPQGLRWPTQGASRVPFWAYSDPQVYRREQERIFTGDVWAYVGLAAEIPERGDFRRSSIGDRPVIVVRGISGEINVVENRCSHRGVQFCQARHGSAKEFICPYHRWAYDLAGNLIGLPFKRGLAGQGGMPEGFDTGAHGLRRLRVAQRHGVIFASFSDAVEPLEEYLGPEMLPLFDRLFDGRALRILGYSRQAIPANWKLMFENVKDPYHATLMHVFLVTFGLFRADQPSQVRVDASGRHALLLFQRGDAKQNAELSRANVLRSNLKLQDETLLEKVDEYAEYTNTMQSIWPNIIFQQQSNSLATRQIVTRGVGEFELVWTFFGYADDSEEITRLRLRQANLMGPAGLVSLDDSEVLNFLQSGVESSPESTAILEMGGTGSGDAPHIITETAVRAFYKHYRKVMDL